MADATLSLRAFDAAGFIVDREVIEADAMRFSLERLLSLDRVLHVDVHYA